MRVKVIDGWMVNNHGSFPCYFDSESVANNFAEGKGEWGSKAVVVKCKILEVPADISISGDDEWYFCNRIDLNGKDAAEKEKLRKTALTKLTEKEKEALGV